MIDQDLEAKDIEQRVHDLNRAMRKIRTAQADKDDVVVELKNTRISRLELLYEDIKPVQDDIPYDNEQFEFALAKSEPPRLWIDMTSFVRMGEDGREYEFVKDTRMGRVILGNSSNRQKIGEVVTDYVAERLLERERMIEGEWLSLSHMIDAQSRYRPEDKKELRHNPDEQNETVADAHSDVQVNTKRNSVFRDLAQNETVNSAVGAPKHSSLWLLMWFVLGLLGGAAVLFILFWFGLTDQIVQMVR